ncbi:MAG: DUF2188 domain-containing protein, partial [Holophagales bacterium]|nr:DUF2188 domain-containing protein [Holophagales bacterium]
MTDTPPNPTTAEAGEACCGTAGRIASIFFVGAAVAVASMALSRLLENLRSRAPEPAPRSPSRSTPSHPAQAPEPSGARHPAEPEPAPTPMEAKPPTQAPANDDEVPVESPVVVFHVEPKNGDWVVKAENGEMPPEIFPTKKDALTAGRAAARSQVPSRLVIHNMDGT